MIDLTFIGRAQTVTGSLAHGETQAQEVLSRELAARGFSKVEAPGPGQTIAL